MIGIMQSDNVCENNTCVRVIRTAGKTFATVDKMLISADIILDFDDIIYTDIDFLYSFPISTPIMLILSIAYA